MQIEEQAETRPGARLPPAGMAVLDGAAQSAARSADARRVEDARQKIRATRALIPNPPVSPGLPSLPSTPTRVQPQAEAAPAAADPATGRGTRRGRDAGHDTPTIALDTSVLDELPAPRGSKDASGQPYKTAASWLGEWLQKQCTLREATAAAEAAAEVRATAAAVAAGEETAEAHSMAVHESTIAKLTDTEKNHLEQLREEAKWSEAEERHLERLNTIINTRDLKRQLQQAEAALQQLSVEQSTPVWGLEDLKGDCPICQEVLGTAGDVVQLQCLQPPGAIESAPHLFHLRCITHHAKACGTRGFGGTPGSQPSCPTCRAPMTHCRSVQTGKLQPLTTEAEAGQSAAPVTSLADRAALRQLAQLQQDLPPAPPDSARAAMRFRPDYYEGPRPSSRSSGTRHGPRLTAASTATASAPSRATRVPVTSASPADAVDDAAASPAAAASAPASTDAPAVAASRGSPMPAEPPTTPMETDEPHAAPRPAAATSGEGGAEGAAPSRAPVPDEDVTESGLFSEEGEQEEGGGTLSSYHSGPNP